jgi:hypothetical protein
MKLTLEPLVQLGRVQKTTFNLKINFDADLAAAHEKLGAWSFNSMCSYDLLVKARTRANSFIEKNNLKVASDDTTLLGVDMIVYYDVDPSVIDAMPEPIALTLDEMDLEHFDLHTLTRRQ